MSLTMLKVFLFAIISALLCSCGVKKPPLPPLKDSQKIERSKI